MSEASSHKPGPAALSGLGSPARGSSDGLRSDPMLASTDGQNTVISSRPPAAALPFTGSMPPLDSGSQLEGERLGQFILEKFIGGGGMGVVFRALDTTLNREVAVKVLSRNQSADEEALRRFRNEAQSAARLNHDNIARVHYVGEDRGVHYIVFEFIEGVNIRDMVERRGPLPLDEAVSYTFQIAQALEHASQRDVIHRDIKPSNVLVTPDGKAKLVDMGLARLNQVAHANNDLTASGVTLGTFDYISPEQARDPRSADVRSDLYSLGCSFFYMLTGRPPFPEGTVLQKLLQHQADIPIDPRTLRPDLPLEITRILTRLLAKNPAQRYQQPIELTDELAAIGEKLGMQLSSPRTVWVPPKPLPTARWRRHLPWALPLAALCLIVLILDAFWTAGSYDEVESRPAMPAGTLRTSPPLAARNVPLPPAKPTSDDSTKRQPDKLLEKPIGESPSIESADKTSDPPASAANAAAANLPILPTEPVSWRQRLAELSWGAGVNMGELTARASSNLSSQLGPQSLGSLSELQISGEKSRPHGLRQPAAQTTPSSREGLLIVGENESGPRTYASLHAACGDAKSGDTIELRFNGRRVEKPIALPNLKLTICAGQNYQPVVVFRPQLDPFKFMPSSTSMLTIAGGQLNVKNVHWELDLPRNVPPDWALFETRRADLLRFEKCSFTIRNASLGLAAYHAGVAFFDIKAAPGTGTMAMDPNAEDEHTLNIDLEDCIARGEATFVRTNELQALKLTWQNGLLATSERLLVAAGGASQPKVRRYLRLDLRHVTVMAHNGMALLTNSESEPYQLRAEFNCNDSILVSTAKPPLIEQRGSDSVEEFSSHLQWSGDRNDFSGFDILWRILNNAGETASKQMRFEDWQRYWADRSHFATKDAVVWKNFPSAQQIFHAHTPSDYALETGQANNPALGAAADGSNLGSILGQLPLLPANPPTDDKLEGRGARPIPRPLDGS